MKKVNVALTGSSGRIGYSLIFRIASGEMFGQDTAIDLRLFDVPQAQSSLDGIAMELEDGAYPLLASLTKTSDPRVAFKEADWALLVGSVPRGPGMERKDLLKINGQIFAEQGRALSDVAKNTCKVLVVGNPCNTNAYIAKSAAPNLPSENFFAMTMLDQSRGRAQLAAKVNVPVQKVKNLAIWGNHSSTQFPDFFHATIGNQPVTDVIEDKNWLENIFLETVQKRGAAIIQARGLSSVGSAAQAVIDTIRNLTTPTPEGEFFSVAACSDGSYGIPQGMIFGFPIYTDGKAWKIVQGIKHNAFANEKIAVTLKELQEEKEAALEVLA